LTGLFKRALTGGFFFFLITLIAAGDPRLEAESFYMEVQSWTQPFSAEQISRMSLVASGLEGADLEIYQQRMEEEIQRFRTMVLPGWKGLSDYELGEQLLLWIHSHFLKSYQEPQTYMNVLLDDGRYNCVSSAILYLIFAVEAGLDAAGVETVDHAFCRILVNGEVVDIETTNIHGFDPGTKKEFTQAFNRTGYSYVPPGNYRSRSERNIRQMVALILQNRIALGQRRRNHEEVVGLAVDMYTLAPSEKTLAQLNDVLRNWSAELNDRGYYKEGFLFLLALSTPFPDLPDNEDILFSLAHNYLADMTNRGNLEEAYDFLDTYGEVFREERYRELYSMVIQQKLQIMMRTAPYEESLQAIRQAAEQSYISARLKEEWISWLHQNKAIQIADNQYWLEAWRFLESLPREEAAYGNIPSMREQMKRNWTVSLHNRFVDFMNQQRYSEARQVLEEGLEMDPENRTFLQDQRSLAQVLE